MSAKDLENLEIEQFLFASRASLTVPDQTLGIDENQASGSSLGTVQVDGARSRERLTYTLLDDAGGLFSIDSRTGEITATAPLDHELADVYSLTVQVVGRRGRSDTATITVNVGDANEAPTANDVAVLVDEGLPVGTVVATVAASDPDDSTEPFGALSYQITDGDPSGLFTIDAATGQITATAPLDHEAMGNHLLTITVTDGAGLSDTATVTVQVGDVNEAPVASDTVLSVDENQAAGTVVGTVAASDPDDPLGPSGMLSYQITDGDPAGLFTVDADTGQIATTAPLDHEAADSHLLTVTVTDGAGLSDTATVTVQVGDVNEAPTASDAVFTIDENRSFGTAVGTVMASDPDEPTSSFDRLRYTIADGNQAGLFAINSDTGLITTTAILDHETTVDQLLTVTVADRRGLSDTATVTVNIADVNERPSVFSAFLSVDENQAAGTVVGMMEASDRDDPSEPFGTLNLSITAGNETGLFAIDPATGLLTTTAPLDRETIARHVLTVTATDGGGLSSPATATIDVNDLPDGPSPFLLLSDLDGSNGFGFFRDSSGFDNLGSSVSGAGDVNGDGFADVIIGGLDAGQSYVVFGRASGFTAQFDLSSLDGSNGFRLDDPEAAGSLGGSVSGAGDVNGDGLDDIIVGAPSTDLPGAVRAGVSYVILGQTGGFSPVLDLAALDGTNGFRLEGVSVFDQVGASVSGAGDINGDGYDDVMVGAPTANESNGRTGVAHVVFGKAGGFTPSLKLDTLDGGNGFRLDGIAASDNAGFSVSDAGDVNGDGFDDIVVGTRGDGYYSSGVSQSYVVFGKVGGFAPSLDLADLDGLNGFRLQGLAPGDGLGVSVSSAGDINGDGYADVIAGARSATADGLLQAGQTFVVFGKAGGFTSVVDLATLDGTNGFRLDGASSYERSGTSVSNAGDVNGDGFDDLFIGAPDAGDGGYYSSETGVGYIVFGRAAGFGPDLDLAALDGVNGFRLEQAPSVDGLGTSVSGAGDVNGDGFDDVILGGYKIYGSAERIPFVVFGRDFSGLAVTHLGSAADDSLVGSASDDVMVAGQGNDLLEGLAGNDVLTGALGADSFLFKDGDGNDKITDFEAGTGTGDVVDIADFGFADLASLLSQSNQVGSNLVLSLDADDSITLVGVRSGDLDADDFAFV